MGAVVLPGFLERKGPPPSPLRGAPATSVGHYYSVCAEPSDATTLRVLGLVPAGGSESASTVLNPGEPDRFYTFLLTRSVAQLWGALKDLG